MSDYVDTVDIEGTQYDIQDTATKQTADQNQQDIEAMKESADYSTTEHLTGAKASDGRPIYKKQIVTTTPEQSATFPGNENSKSILVGAPVKDFISCSGFINYESTGVVVPLGVVLTQTQFSTYWCRNNTHPQNPNTIAIAVGASAVNLKLVIDVEYTKTTDTPQP